jgi:hypothetical protein
MKMNCTTNRIIGFKTRPCNYAAKKRTINYGSNKGKNNQQSKVIDSWLCGRPNVGV